MYHSISEIPSEWTDDTVSPEKLESDLLALKNNGYTPIFFDDYTDAMLGNEKLPEKPVFITFDDGYSCNYKYAYPILKKLKMKATFSVIGWSIGRSVNKDGSTPIFPHFSLKEAKEMYDSGFVDIQHHTYDLHNNGIGVDMLPGESEAAYRERFKADVLKLKNIIESSIGNQVTVFTYPYGKYNSISESVLKELGFKYTLTVEGGVSELSEGTYSLKRINVPQRMPSEELIKTIND